MPQPRSQGLFPSQEKGPRNEVVAWRSNGKQNKNIDVIRLQVQNTLQLQKELLSHGWSDRVVMLCKMLNFRRAYLYPARTGFPALCMRRLQVFALNFDWFSGMSESFVIGQSNTLVLVLRYPLKISLMDNGQLLGQQMQAERGLGATLRTVLAKRSRK